MFELCKTSSCHTTPLIKTSFITRKFAPRYLCLAFIIYKFHFHFNFDYKCIQNSTIFKRIPFKGNIYEVILAINLFPYITECFEFSPADAYISLKNSDSSLELTHLLRYTTSKISKQLFIDEYITFVTDGLKSLITLQ